MILWAKVVEMRWILWFIGTPNIFSRGWQQGKSWRQYLHYMNHACWFRHATSTFAKSFGSTSLVHFSNRSHWFQTDQTGPVTGRCALVSTWPRRDSAEGPGRSGARSATTQGSGGRLEKPRSGPVEDQLGTRFSWKEQLAMMVMVVV